MVLSHTIKARYRNSLTELQINVKPFYLPKEGQYKNHLLELHFLSFYKPIVGAITHYGSAWSLYKEASNKFFLEFSCGKNDGL